MTELVEPHSAPLPERCGTVVVGAGMTGLEMAKELERLGVSDVVVLEAGPVGETRHLNGVMPAATALRMWLEPATDPYFRRTWASAFPPHYLGASGLRQRLGGRSLYWYGIMLPIEDWALTEPWWPRAVVDDLKESWRGGESLYSRLTGMLEEWRGDPPDERKPVYLQDLDLLPAPLARRPVPGGGWRAYTALDAWRDPGTGEVVRPPGVRCFARTEVVEVMVRDGTCHGVLARRGGALAHIQARRVVLCGGTLENSRLAIQALSAAGALDTPRLPRLADHIVQGLLLRLDGAHAEALRAAVPPGCYLAPCAPEVRSNLFVDVHERGPAELLLEIRTMGEQLPSEDSYVECHPRERLPWPVTAHSRPSAGDRDLLRAQRQVIEQVYERFAELVGCTATRPEFCDYDDPERTNSAVLPENLARIPIGQPVTWVNSLGTEDHEGGTLPIGSLLDDECEFVAVRGLFAAGPSTFPRLGAANPALTALALAHRLAARLADDSADPSDR